MAASGFDPESDDIVASINVTPLVDIILVLLIVFMVTATFISDPVVEVDLPRAATAEDAPSRSVAVVVDADGQLYLNGRETTGTELEAALTREVRQNDEVNVVLGADGRIDYQLVMNVIDITKRARVQNLALNVQRPVASL
jgi:biopolymer transport protein TolR